MLDYEITEYRVYWKRLLGGRLKHYSRGFDTEDDAINFITEHRHNWESFKLVQTRTAIL